MDEIYMKVDRFGIEFPDAGWDVPWSQIGLRGVDHWCDHLRHKTWMTEAALQRFREAATRGSAWMRPATEAA